MWFSIDNYCYQLRPNVDGTCLHILMFRTIAGKYICFICILTWDCAWWVNVICHSILLCDDWFHMQSAIDQIYCATKMNLGTLCGEARLHLDSIRRVILIFLHTSISGSWRVRSWSDVHGHTYLSSTTRVSHGESVAFFDVPLSRSRGKSCVTPTCAVVAAPRSLGFGLPLPETTRRENAWIVGSIFSRRIFQEDDYW